MWFHYVNNITPVHDGMYEASWSAFPGRVVQIEAADEEEALKRAALTLVGLITSDRT